MSLSEKEWEKLAETLGAAWPPFEAERRALYFEVLADLPTEEVTFAVDELVREDRDELPPPGTIRQRALGRLETSGVDYEVGPASAGVWAQGPPESSPRAVPPAPPPTPTSAPAINPLAAMAGSEERLSGVAGAQDPARGQTSGMAIAALTCGIVGVLVVPFVCAILAIVFGAVAMNQIKRDRTQGGELMAVWGLALGIFSLIVWTAIVILAVATAEDSAGDFGQVGALSAALLLHF